jgi:hypothetical protein
MPIDFLVDSTHRRVSPTTPGLVTGATASGKPMTFMYLTTQATVAEIKSLLTLPENAAANQPFVEGDHWQDGDGWVGPGPTKNDPQRTMIYALIEQAFVQRNVVNELIDRHVSAVLGREPRWGWTPVRRLKPDEEPTDAEQTDMEELDAALTTWWDTQQAHRLLKSMIFALLWSQRASFRVYAPTLTGGTIRAGDLPEALTNLYLDVPDPGMAGVWEDPKTRQKVGIIIVKDDENQDAAELYYLDGAQTVLKLVTTAKEPSTDTRPRINKLNGILPMFELMLARPFITEQIRSLQKSLNMTLTLLSKGLNDNTFQSLLVLNAMPPGYWTYEDQPDENGQKIRKEYIIDFNALKQGGQQTQFISGIDYKDEQNRTQIKDPTAVYRAPIDPSGTIKGAEFWYSSMLDEGRQSHVVVNKEAGLSGKSKEQSRGDFVDSTNDTQLQTELAGRNLLMALVAMSETQMNVPGKWTAKYRPVFKCRPNYGPLSVEERAQNVSEAKDGFMADETAMALNGLDDTDAEQAKIAAQLRARLGLSQLQADAVATWKTAGVSLEVSLLLIGMDEADIKKYMERNKKAVKDEMPPVDPATKARLGNDITKVKLNIAKPVAGNGKTPTARAVKTPAP